MESLVKTGRTFFAVSMATFGILYLLRALFATGPGSGPPWIPTHPFWGDLIAIVLIVAAGCFVAKVQVRCAAIALAITILVRVLWVYVPKLVATPHDPGPWTSGSELIALAGAAWVLAGAPPTIKLGRILFAVPLLVFGIQHFLYAGFIATLVPAWIPGHLFWAYFVGVSFVAAALSISSQIRAGLSATCLGIMFLLWVLILHLPRVAASPHNGNEWTSAFVALAMSGGAFLVAGSSKKN
jgi:hypothetical protein